MHRETTRPRDAVALRLDVADRPDHLPGQHYVVRLTADDGYTASRSYSIASSPTDPLLELGIERLDDGEVSGYLADVVQPGDELEVRGPIGGWFVWDGTTPAVCVGGGTGVVPFVSMARYAWEAGRSDLLRLAVSARTRGELPYVEELAAAGAVIAITREQTVPPARPHGSAHRCRPGAAADRRSHLLRLRLSGFRRSGHAAADRTSACPATVIKVERFGPSG